MSTPETAVSWVVYQSPIRNKREALAAVCEQSEWDAMELAQPGHYTLVRAGILNEGEAERLARYGPSGQPVLLSFPKISRS